MDVVQKVKDLMNLALDGRTPENERNNAAMGAIRLIDEYKLLGTKKRIEVAAEIIEKVTSPGFVDGVASRAEGIASGVERIKGTVKKVSDLLRTAEAAGRGGVRGRRRRYSEE
jgi:hypothetical protein